MQRRQALRFVVFHTDQGFCRFDQLLQYPGARNNLVGAFAHQHVIGGDIWLAFGAIDNQGGDAGFRLYRQLDRGGKARAAHASQPRVADSFDQLAFIQA